MCCIGYPVKILIVEITVVRVVEVAIKNAWSFQRVVQHLLTQRRVLRSSLNFLVREFTTIPQHTQAELFVRLQLSGGIPKTPSSRVTAAMTTSLSAFSTSEACWR